jgi:cytochrome c peroxidase
MDGTWVESSGWTAFLSLEQDRLAATVDGVPPEDLKAIRFRVGLDEATDKSDPARWAPDEPLHPDVCGLHWGWQSGYVFLALEGHWTPADGKVGGFSYHLAGTAQPMMVELPVRFSGVQPTTIRLAFDVDKVLGAGEIVRSSTSSHSRDGDSLAAGLKRGVPKAFRVLDTRSDIYQPAAAAKTAGRDLPRGTTPFLLNVSARLPQVKLPEGNPLTVEGVALGDALFHDKRLSRANDQSCAGCHDRRHAFSDGRKISVGTGGAVGRRSTMPLVNLAWARDFFWDGRAPSLREQVLVPIQTAHELNETLDRVVAKLEQDDTYPARFAAAFGAPGINADRIAKALEQFVLTLVSQDSRFDRAARKLATLTPQEQRGLQLFITEHDPARGLRGADCFHCHGGNLFTNHELMNNGLEERGNDLGRMEVTGKASDRGKFKVPTLRNVALTAPYMHDGRFATLEAVVDHYDGPLHRSATLDPNLAKHPEKGLGLKPEDKAALVAFLKSLTDESFASPTPPAPALARTTP